MRREYNDLPFVFSPGDYCRIPDPASMGFKASHDFITDPIRYIERASIRQFLTQYVSCLQGKVLDYGCGDSPYRDLISSTDYVPFDSPGMLPTLQHPQGLYRDVEYYDTILCTQVLQYSDDPEDLLSDLGSMLKIGGHLVLTYPTNWDEVAGDSYAAGMYSDHFRFTKAGMEMMLKAGTRMESNWTILHHELRAVVQIGNFRFPLGYGLIARRES